MKGSIVFIISFVSALLFLGLERLVGIEWDFHPDAETYVFKYSDMAEYLLQQNVLTWLNNSYYLVSYLFNGNMVILILINIIAYSFTNVIFYKSFSYFLEENQLNSSLIFLFYIWIFVFPYRLHLSVQVLKDTLIILFLSIIYSKSKFRYLGWVPILLLRVFCVFYVLPLLSTKYLKIFLFIFLLGFFAFPDEILTALADKNDVSMTFRDFDVVPTFSELGLLGVFIRSMVWPIFGLTGVYILISPSIAFFPVALGTLFTQIWAKKCVNKWAISLGVFLTLSAIAALVNGFTSYIRYTFPMIVVLPLILLTSLSKEKVNQPIFNESI